MKRSYQMKSTKLLVIIAVMQGLILAGQWLGQPSLVSPAQAQVPDAGAQRERMIDEMKNMSGKLDQLAKRFEGRIGGAGDRGGHSLRAEPGDRHPGQSVPQVQYGRADL